MLVQTLTQIRMKLDPVDAGMFLQQIDFETVRNMDRRVVIPLCGALWRASVVGDENVHQEMVDKGSVTWLVETLHGRHDDAEDVIWILGALVTVLSTANVDAVVALDQARGIEAILDCLSVQQGISNVLEWSCRCLCCVLHLDTSRDRDRVELHALAEKISALVQRCRCADTVVRSMQISIHDDSQSCYWSVRAMMMLYELGDPAEKRAIVAGLLRTGIVNDLATQMEGGFDDNNGDELWWWWKVLSLLLLQEPDNAHLRSIASSVTLKVNQVLSDSTVSPTVLEVALWLMSEALMAIDMVDELLAIPVLVDMLTAVLERHHDRQAIVQWVVWILWKFSEQPGRFSAHQIDSAVPLIMSTVNVDTASEQLVLQVCGFICNVCHLSELEISSFPLRAASQCIASEHRAVREVGVKAVCSLYLKFPDVVVSPEERDRLCSLLYVSRRDSQLRIPCWKALTSVARCSDQAMACLLELNVLSEALLLLGEAQDTELTLALLDFATSCTATSNVSRFTVPNDAFDTVLKLLFLEIRSRQLRVKCLACLRSLLCYATDWPTTETILSSLSAHADRGGSDDHVASCALLWIVFAHRPATYADVDAAFHLLVGLLRRYEGGRALEYTAEVFYNAAGALSVICNSAIDHESFSFDSGEADTIVTALYGVLDKDRQAAETSELFMKALLFLCRINEDAMIQVGVIVSIIDVMLEYEGNMKIQEICCAALAQLSASESLQVIISITQTEGIDLLLRAMNLYKDDWWVQFSCCKAYSHLSIDEEARSLLMAQGGIRSLVDTMKGVEKLSVVEYACGALYNIIPDATEEALIDSGIADVVIFTMKSFPQSVELQTSALGLLERLVRKSSRLKALVCAAAGAETVMNALNTFLGLPAVLERGFGALLSMLDVCISNVVELHGIEMILTGMLVGVENEKVQKHALGCLSCLASRAANVDTIREAGGVKAVTLSMWGHLGDEELLVQACAVIAELAAPSFVADEGEIGAIVTAMKRFRMSPLVQEQGCRALARYLPSSRNAAVMAVNAGSITAVVTAAASKFPNSCAALAAQVLSCV